MIKFQEFTAKDLDELIERDFDEENEEAYGEEGWYEFKYRDYERALTDDKGKYILDENQRVQTDPASLKGVYLKEIDSWVSTAEEHGGEGQGDEFWVVVKVLPNDPASNTPAHDWVAPRWFKKLGYYASYDGGYLDGDCIEVRPLQRMVTFYE